MREKKLFARRTRTRNTDEMRKKYLLVYEGEETEAIYFENVNTNRSYIGIDPLIELIPIERSYSERGWSNPKKIIDRVMLNLNEGTTGNISYETLLNWIMDYLCEKQILTVSGVRDNSLWEELKESCVDALQVSLTDTVKDLEGNCAEIMTRFCKKVNIDTVVDRVSSIINNRTITYAEGFDKVCLIIDRDRESFVAHPHNNQYEYVLNKCREKGFGFYLTNPCFEFWLLLHYDDISDLNEEALLENRKVASKLRYTECELRKRMGHYKKTAYDVDWFIKHINTAIANEKKFCEEEEELEYSIGSRIGLLIEEMRTK